MTLIHATCVAIGGRGVLLAGASGRGKSDLALRLIDRGAALVSDDYTELSAEPGGLVARPPARIARRMEVRGVGIVAVDHLAAAPVALLADLDALPERLPEAEHRTLNGVAVPLVRVAALEPSAPLKLEWALRLVGAAA